MTTEFLVLDANLIFTSVTPNDEKMRIRKQIQDWQEAGYLFIAPTLWYYEVTSALCKMVRFGRFTEAEANVSLLLAQEFPIQGISPDEAQMQLAVEWTYRLKRAAAYDSFYLALAEIYECEFWTADSKLVNAAQRSWVKLWS